MPIAIHARHLNKTYTSSADPKIKIKALDDLSIAVNEGEILGILGPNGAGKTTFLNVLSTLVLPDSGSIDILGIKSHPANFQHLRQILNMSSGYPNFPWSLSIEENLRFYGRLYGLSGIELNKKVEELIGIFDLSGFANRRFDELSSGNKQRLALAKSMLNDPKVIFLDEPTVGLDPDVALKLRAVIRDLLKAKGVTVLLTTHNMAEAQAMCDRVAFIKNGQILRLATPQDLMKAHHTDDLEQVFVQLAHLPGNTTAVANIDEVNVQSLVLNVIEHWDLAAWFNRCYAFTIRNYLFAIRNFFAFAELLFWPMVSLISVGLMGNYLKLQSDSLNFIMTGAIAAGVLQVTQLDVAYSLLYEVWSKSLKQTLLTPVGVTENLFGSWATGIVRGLAVFAVLAICAIWMFHFQLPSITVTTVFLLGIFMCAFLLGLLVNVLILRFGQKAEITAWMFAYLFMLICGIYYPVEILPIFFRVLAYAIPLTYLLEYFRRYDLMQAMIGFSLVFVYFILGLNLLRSSYHHARQKGIIVRLSE